MGGAAKVATDVGTLGLDRVGGPAADIGKAFSWINPVGWASNAVAITGRTVAGLNTPAKTIADSMSVLQGQQLAAAQKAEQDMLQQPRQVAPDNFLEAKSRAISGLRAGILSTITGAGGTPSPLVYSPALAGAGPGKTKLGA